MTQIVQWLGWIALTLTLSACQPDRPEPKLEPVGETRVTLERGQCEKSGGAFHQLTKSGAYVCQRIPRDAGKPCTGEQDCEGACLARSMTCAPVVPLVGCNEVLTNSGIRVTECVQ